MLAIVAEFFPEFLSGFVVNLEIGGIVVLLAVAIGVPLSVLRHRFAWLARPIGAAVRLMQALPTYVAMFFILTLLPRDTFLFGTPITGLMAVIFSLSIYLTAYVAEDARDALVHLDRNERERALLFLPNLLRGFVVVVMSSGFGAAVGVSEAVSVTTRHAERLPALSDRILLFAVATIFFALVVGTLNLIIRYLIALLSPELQDARATDSGPDGVEGGVRKAERLV
jgi:ABC-type amino acid transport system permease subunit